MVTEGEETAGCAHMLECTDADDKLVHLKCIVLLTMLLQAIEFF